MFESFHLFNYFNLATENYSFAHLQFTRRQLQSGWWCTPRCPPSWRWIIDILQTVCLSLAWWYMSAPGNYAQQAGFSVPHVIINSLGCHSSLSSSTFKHIQELPDVTPARVQIASWFSTSAGFFFSAGHKFIQLFQKTRCNGSTEQWRLKVLWTVKSVTKGTFPPRRCFIFYAWWSQESSNADRYVLRIRENSFHLLYV